MQDSYGHPALAAVLLTDVLHALSDPSRLSIVAALRDGSERGWGSFEGSLAASTLSHHIKVLRLAGLIRNRREGTRCHVSLRSDIEDRFPGLLAAVMACVPPSADVPGELSPNKVEQ